MTATTITTDQGILEHVDPAAIVIETNVRKDVDLNAEFIASIKQHGIMTPVSGYRNADGAITVRAGQRRILGAMKAGIPTIPVYITAVDVDVDGALRISTQVVENIHRAELNTPDMLQAVGDLALVDLTAAQIAKRLGITKDAATAGTAAAKSKIAVEAASTPGADLTKLAILAEFENDPEAVERLLDTLTDQPEYFDHRAQQMRDQRIRDEKRAANVAAAIASYTDAGTTILTTEEAATAPAKRLSDLRAPEGERITPEQHSSCAGHAVVIAAQGWNDEAQLYFFCTDPAAHGHTIYSWNGTTTPALTKDEQSQARREVIANNRDWRSAEEVRREWLGTLLNRKTLPADAKLYVALIIAKADYDMVHGWGNGHSLAHELLQVPLVEYGKPNAFEGILRSNPKKVDQVLLAIVIDAMEVALAKNTWRTPTTQDSTYLNQLEAWGYTLSEVEQIVTGKRTPTN